MGCLRRCFCCKTQVTEDGRSTEDHFYEVKEELSVVSDEGRSVYSNANSHFHESRTSLSVGRYSPQQYQIQQQQDYNARSSLERSSIWDWLQGFSPFGSYADVTGEPETVKQVQEVTAELLQGEGAEDEQQSVSESGRGCLQIFHAPLLRGGHHTHPHHHPHPHPHHHPPTEMDQIASARSASSKSPGTSPRLQFGKTLHRLGDMAGGREPRFCWCPADPQSFRVRSKDYMKTRRKVACEGQIYELVNVDLYSFEKKVFHIAKHIDLPSHLTNREWGDGVLPPVLVINILLPIYPAVLFGEKDGKGHSLVYYFALPGDFRVDKVNNQAAINLLKTFFSGEHGHHFRERMKLIPRIVNIDEWAKRGPLSSAELGLLRRYNDKPVLTRPAHKFFRGQCYFEIDLDVHMYPFVARKAFQGYVGKLNEVVFENAFVIQGNSAEELPELLLGCTRVFRVDFQKLYPLPVQKQNENIATEKLILDVQNVIEEKDNDEDASD